MKSPILLLASRYVFTRAQEHTVTLMMLMAGVSIFVGVFSLTLVTAIMNGFEESVHQKMKNIHPTATIYAPDAIALDAIMPVITNEFPEISAVSPYAVGHVLVYSSTREDSQPLMALIKAIDPLRESAVTALESKIVDGKPLLTVTHERNVLIGKELAQEIGLSPADTFSLFFIEPPHEHQRKVTIEQQDAVVGSIFNTGIDEYDSTILYSSFPFFHTLFPDVGVTQIGLAFHPTAHIPTVIKKLRTRLGLEVCTWQELYPALISALTLEKYAMFFILLLITLAASINIIALIFMLIAQKKADIAILRALGMRYQTIQWLFIAIGVGISLLATVLGILGAWLISFLLERYPFIQLPDVYYVTHLPAHLTLSIVALVFCTVLCIALIASWIATRQLRGMNIAHVLRYEG